MGISFFLKTSEQGRSRNDVWIRQSDVSCIKSHFTKFERGIRYLMTLEVNKL